MNWADFSSVAALPDGTLFAHWLETSSPDAYSYDVRLTRSTDGGETWSTPMTAHDDGVPTEHGFVAMTSASSDEMAVVWLDGREMAGGAGAMTLRSARFDRSGAKRADERVDERVCDCCQTALVRAGDALVLAYRDRTAGEVRDVVVRRSGAGTGEWSEPLAVGAEGWTIAGCPVNGPALAADDDRVALAWFTKEGEAARTKVAFSRDAGATWSAATTVDEGRPMGRVDVVMLDGGAALVAWIEMDGGEGATLRVRRVAPEGALEPSLVVADISAARATGFPRMERQGSEVLLAWTDAGEAARIRTAALVWGSR